MYIQGANAVGRFNRGEALTTEPREGGSIEEIRFEPCVRNPQRSALIMHGCVKSACMVTNIAWRKIHSHDLVRRSDRLVPPSRRGKGRWDVEGPPTARLLGRHLARTVNEDWGRAGHCRGCRYLAEYQSFPMPMSTLRGTRRDMACSISSRTIAAWASASSFGASSSSSSWICTSNFSGRPSR